jgi:DNA-binding LytR/AlgR family response regulator
LCAAYRCSYKPDRYENITLDDIYFIEGAGNYINFHTKGRQIIALLPLNDMIKMLPPEKFARIHKFFIISLEHIGIIEKARVIINGSPIAIGITYREQFSKMIWKK